MHSAAMLETGRYLLYQSCARLADRSETAQLACEIPPAKQTGVIGPPGLQLRLETAALLGACASAKKTKLSATQAADFMRKSTIVCTTRFELYEEAGTRRYT